MVERSKEYKKIGDRLLKEPTYKYLKDAGVKIAWLSSDQEKKKSYKTVFGDCTKVNERYKWICHYDFMITVYEPNVINFTEKQIEILLRHELLHCGVNGEGNDISFYVVPHDVEEFTIIAEEYGFYWCMEDNKICQEETTQIAERT